MSGRPPRVGLAAGLLTAALGPAQAMEPAATLAAVDRIVAQLSAATPRDLAAVAGATSLHFRGDGPIRRAEAGDAEAIVGAEYRQAGLLILTVRQDPCVRPEAVRERYGTETRFTPVRPGRRLPAPWYVEYRQAWARLSFGFLASEPHHLDGCLVETVLDWTPGR